MSLLHEFSRLSVVYCCCVPRVLRPAFCVQLALSAVVSACLLCLAADRLRSFWWTLKFMALCHHHGQIQFNVPRRSARSVQTVTLTHFCSPLLTHTLPNAPSACLSSRSSLRSSSPCLLCLRAQSRSVFATLSLLLLLHLGCFLVSLLRSYHSILATTTTYRPPPPHTLLLEPFRAAALFCVQVCGPYLPSRPPPSTFLAATAY